jgi:HPt (histidine-containing phosphotransfer) domain-containing protein
MAEPEPLRVIDWDESLSMAGGSQEFLKELIVDLLNEARSAEEEIGEAIIASEYTVIMRSAHRIAGTCSYFCCDATLDVCHQLKTAGHDGMRGPENPAALRDLFDKLFIRFVECLQDLRDQIAIKFPA